MSKFELVFKPSANKDIQKIDTVSKKRIIKKLKFFMDQDNPIDYAIKLKGDDEAQYRWRIGTYRVVFDIQNSQITVLRVQHRKDVYRS